MSCWTKRLGLYFFLFKSATSFFVNLQLLPISTVDSFIMLLNVMRFYNVQSQSWTVCNRLWTHAEQWKSRRNRYLTFLLTATEISVAHTHFVGTIKCSKPILAIIQQVFLRFSFQLLCTKECRELDTKKSHCGVHNLTYWQLGQTLWGFFFLALLCMALHKNEWTDVPVGL